MDKFLDLKLRTANLAMVSIEEEMTDDINLTCTRTPPTPLVPLPRPLPLAERVKNAFIMQSLERALATASLLHGESLKKHQKGSFAAVVWKL